MAVQRTFHPQPKLVPIYRPQKDGRLGEPRACGVLPGIEPSTSGLRVRRANHYTIVPYKLHVIIQREHHSIWKIRRETMLCECGEILLPGNYEKDENSQQHIKYFNLIKGLMMILEQSREFRKFEKWFTIIQTMNQTAAANVSTPLLTRNYLTSDLKSAN